MGYSGVVIENMELLQRYSEPPISFYNKLITVVTGDNLKVQSKHEKRIASFFLGGQEFLYLGLLLYSWKHFAILLRVTFYQTF